MPNPTVKLTGGHGFQDIGTIGQTPEQLSGNIQSINAILDVGLRNTRNFKDAWIRVSDLVALGFVTLNGDTLTAATFGGGSGTVNVQNSITGDGSVGSPLELQGDVPTPGNSFYYGTDSGGAKGWFVLPGGGSSPLTTKGDLFGHSTVDARIPVGTNGQVLTADNTQAVGVSWQTPGAGGGAVPGTIPDLTLWIETDNILGAAGGIISRLQEKTPWIGGVAAALAVGTVAIDSSQLNSLNVLKWPAASGGGLYVLQPGLTLVGGATFFIVAKGSTGAGSQSIIGGTTSNTALYLANGSANILLVDGGTAVIGTSSAAWTAGTWFQANVTYNASTGAYAFRQARTAANSGTGATGSGTGASSEIGGDGGTAFLNAASIAAIIVYNRVLTGPEITVIENYLFAKWGV